MSYEITLHDSTNSWTSPTPNTPLTEKIIESASEVTTLDMNVYIDVFNIKREWTIQWGYMDAANYALLKAFYTRQFTAFEFPDVTIPDLSVSSVVVRATLSDHVITDESGLVENVTLTLRETVQLVS